KAIAWMDRLRARSTGSLDQSPLIEITLGSWRRADMHGFIRHAHMQGRPVGVRKDSNSAKPHPARRAHDAACNLTAIGDQNFREHWPPSIMPQPYRIRPERGIPGKNVPGRKPEI